MSRANPFGNLDDFAAQSIVKPVETETIEQIAQATGFPSRKAAVQDKPSQVAAMVAQKVPRRRVTGRNRQINIKATEETIERLYRIADNLDQPLGAVLEQALEALEKNIMPST